MPNTYSITPTPQYRYLEPYSARVFQYDTPTSNLYLAEYANNILKVVGSDCIIKDLNLTARVCKNLHDIEITIAPGLLIHDTTLHEIQDFTQIVVPNCYMYDGETFQIIVYSNYKYIQTVYENPITFEADFYNKLTHATINPWNSNRYRVVFGLVNYSVIDGEVRDIWIQSNDVISVNEDTRILNGQFNYGIMNWTGMNCQINATEELGNPAPSCEVSIPRGDFQDVYQTIETNKGDTYKVDFDVKYVGSVNTEVEVQAVMMDGPYSNKSVRILTTKRRYVKNEENWVHFEFRFTAISPTTTLCIRQFMKYVEDKFYIDNVSLYHIVASREVSNIADRIDLADGGEFDTE